MLNFDLYGEHSVPVARYAPLGPSAWLAWDEQVSLDIRVARAARLDGGAPTLRVRGVRRDPDDWFSIDVRLAPSAHALALVMRNYPAERLYPRLHFQKRKGQPFHVDLPELEAQDHFTRHRIALRDWCPDPAFWQSGDPMDRLTLLIPASPWFVLELAEVAVHEAADA